jgi:RimJ/RimL family protein N-acetyltransferase
MLMEAHAINSGVSQRENQSLKINTQRLLLRPWRDEDLPAFADMNQDPRVMEFFPAVLDRQQSDSLAMKIRQEMDDQGWGFWAVEMPGKVSFIGFMGLGKVGDDLPFAPGVEIGWRLSRDFWGKGYASEAALAALEIGFLQLKLREIVAFTAEHNLRSRALMSRIGLNYSDEKFEHPGVPPGHSLRTHVLYRIKNPFSTAAAGTPEAECRLQNAE